MDSKSKPHTMVLRDACNMLVVCPMLQQNLIVGGWDEGTVSMARIAIAIALFVGSDE
jgi:hypothetical protein